MPMFQLNFDDGSKGFFDSDSTTFFSGEKQKIKIEHFLPKKKVHDNRSSYTPTGLKKSLTPDFVRIVMGFKCNFHCKYCSQGLTDKYKGTSVTEAEKFARRFCTIIQGEPRRFEFWGGEPLVYFKHLRVMFPILRKRFPDTIFSIITNGSLISREILDFLKKYETYVVFSHDGPGQYIRGEDPLENPQKKALWLEYYEASKSFKAKPPSVPFSFAATMTRKNCDLNKIMEFLHKNFAKDVPVFCEVVTAMGGIGKEDTFLETAFDKESLKKLQQNCYSNLVSEENDLCVGYSAFVQTFLAHTMYEDKNFGTSICGSDGENKLFVKIDGTVMACQNSDVPPGFYGYLWDINKVRIPGSTPMQERKSCSHCPLISLCKGACPFMKGNDFADSCEVKRSFYLPAFVFVVNQTFRKKLVSIEGDFHYPIREVIQTKNGKYKQTSRLEINCY